MCTLRRELKRAGGKRPEEKERSSVQNPPPPVHMLQRQADKQRGDHEGHQEKNRDMDNGRGQVKPRLDLPAPGIIASKDAGEEFDRGLNQPFVPAMLLGEKGSEGGRNFGGTGHVVPIEKFPTGQLGAIGKIGVLGQGVMLPASGVSDAAFSPDSRRTVEIEPLSGIRPGGLLDDEMPVEKHGLNLGEQGFVPIQVNPAGLDHADGVVSELVDD